MATENLLDFTKVDPNSRMTLAPNQVVSELFRDESAYLYDDKGADHFDGDFEHRFECELVSLGSNSANPSVVIAGLANALDDWYNLREDGEDGIGLFATYDGTNAQFYAYEINGTNDYFDGNATLTKDQNYFFRSVRDDSEGTYGTYYIYVYSDDYITLVDTFSLTLHAKNDFQYFYAISSRNTGVARDLNTIVQNFDLQETIETYEDFRDYTVVNPNGTMTPHATSIEFDDVARDESAYVYKDFGASYFSGDLEHLLEASNDAYSGNVPRCYIWGLADSVDDFGGIDAASGDFVGAAIDNLSGTYRFRLDQCDAGTLTSDTGNITESTLYYLRAVRSNTADTAYLYIYSDSDRTTLVDTLSVALSAAGEAAFRYFYAASTYDTSTAARLLDGLVRNVNLQEDVSPYEDFTTYTKSDASNHISLTAPTTYADGLESDESAYAYKDYGAGHFGEFEHLLTVNVTDSAADGSASYMWAVANIIDDVRSIDVTHADDFLAFRPYNVSGTLRFYIRECDSGTASSDYYGAPSTDTEYHLRIIRNTSSFLCYIYSDSDRTTLVDILSIGSPVQTTFRYLYSMSSCDVSLARTMDCYTTNLNLQEDVSPYEDFRTYTEQDDSNWLSVYATQARGIGINRTDSCYLYADKGVGHFTDGLDHKFTVKFIPINAALAEVLPWVLSNVVSDIWAMRENDDPYHSLTAQMDADAANPILVYLQEHASDGVVTYDGPFVPTVSTNYFYRVIRDDSVGTYGTIYCYAYSDEDYTTLEDTLTVTLTESTDFRYIYAVNNYDYGLVNSRPHSMIASNLNLQEEAETGALLVHKGMTGGMQILQGGLNA